MDYEKMFNELVIRVSAEEIGRMIVEEGCPQSFGLSDDKYCGIHPHDCPDCWAKVLGMQRGGVMDYEKIFSVLVDRVGKEEAAKIIVKAGCPGLFGLAHEKGCVVDLDDCPNCWANALGGD
jgi:hypothetical protein